MDGTELPPMTEPGGFPPPHRRHRLVASLAAVCAVVGLGACGGGGNGDAGAPRSVTKVAADPATSGGATVSIVNFEFQPPKLTVRAGTKVTWTNRDTAVHSVKDTSPLATPVSPDLAQGATFSITYDRPGSYSYMCGIHNYMTGSVDVVG